MFNIFKLKNIIIIKKLLLFLKSFGKFKEVSYKKKLKEFSRITSQFS